MDREAAWAAVRAAVARLPGWRVNRTEYHPEERRWLASAYDARSKGRRGFHTSVSGAGETEAEALEALARKLERVE